MLRVQPGTRSEKRKLRPCHDTSCPLNAFFPSLDPFRVASSIFRMRKLLWKSIFNFAITTKYIIILTKCTYNTVLNTSLYQWCHGPPNILRLIMDSWFKMVELGLPKPWLCWGRGSIFDIANHIHILETIYLEFTSTDYISYFIR